MLAGDPLCGVRAGVAGDDEHTFQCLLVFRRDGSLAIPLAFPEADLVSSSTRGSVDRESRPPRLRTTVPLCQSGRLQVERQVLSVARRFGSLGGSDRSAVRIARRFGSLGGSDRSAVRIARRSDRSAVRIARRFGSLGGSDRSAVRIARRLGSLGGSDRSAARIARIVAMRAIRTIPGQAQHTSKTGPRAVGAPSCSRVPCTRTARLDKTPGRGLVADRRIRTASLRGDPRVEHRDASEAD